MTADDSEVVKRLRLITTEMTTFITANKDHKYSRYAWILDAMLQEIFEEMAGATDATLAGYIEQFGRVFTWCGSGDDSVLPANIREWLGRNHREMLAISAGTEAGSESSMSDGTH